MLFPALQVPPLETPVGNHPLPEVGTAQNAPQLGNNHPFWVCLVTDVVWVWYCNGGVWTDPPTCRLSIMPLLTQLPAMVILRVATIQCRVWTSVTIPIW